MWTYKEASKYVAAALRNAADAHSRGEFERLEAGLDEFDANLPRNSERRFDKLHIALNFWDGWIDAGNHEWRYYEPIRKDDWPGLARAIAADIERDGEISNSLVLDKFDFRSKYRTAT